MSEDWRQRPEGGSRTGIRILIWIAEHLGRTTLQLILIPVTLYYFVVRKTERCASRAYLGKVTEDRVSMWRIFRHFQVFSNVTADRLFKTVTEHELGGWIVELDEP